MWNFEVRGSHVVVINILIRIFNPWLANTWLNNFYPAPPAVLADRDLFYKEYAVPLEMRNPILTNELVERLYLHVMRRMEIRESFTTGMGDIHEFLTFWKYSTDFSVTYGDQYLHHCIARSKLGRGIPTQTLVRNAQLLGIKTL